MTSNMSVYRAVYFLVLINQCYAIFFTTKPYQPILGNDFHFFCTISKPIVSFEVGFSPVCYIISAYSNGTCQQDSCNASFTYSCNTTTYSLTIPGSLNIDFYHGTTWRCQDPTGGMGASNSVTLNVRVPITKVTMTPTTNDNEERVIEGSIQNVTCYTDAVRPATVIHWFINDDNITHQSLSNVTQVGTRFISTSTIVYTGREVDHNKSLYCKAWNSIDDQWKSTYRILNISVPVKQLTFEPVGLNGVITVIPGRNNTFTCTTSPSRPGATIHWFIGDRNITVDAMALNQQQQQTMYISSSTLAYIAQREDDGKIIYCEAFNIEGLQKITSLNKRLHIVRLPDKVKEVKIICWETKLGVTWRSESDGGHKQVFVVILQNTFTGISFYSNNVSDPGAGLIVQYTTQVLPNTPYIIYIESMNKFGKIRSNEVRYCNTTVFDATTVQEKALTFSAGFGSGAALVIGINIIAITIFCILKKKAGHSDKSKVYEQTKHSTSDTNVYNELDEIQKGRENRTDIGHKEYEEVI